MMFNEALATASEIALQHLGDPNRPVVLVRDLFGKFRVVLPEDRADVADTLAAKLTAALGVYGYAPTSTFLGEFEIGTAASSARVILEDESGAQVVLVDRLLIGTEWSAPPSDQLDAPRRFTLFSMKGGVGRSTTATVLAWHLARQGKRVVVFDLDLESPGVGATMLPHKNLPDYGIVDWFVEDALGASGDLEPQLTSSSPMDTDLDGEILVVPAYGRLTGDYLPKLGRAYFERGPKGPEAWASRLRRLIQSIEAQVRPDVVFFDSRTGLHDTSASLLLALGADTLMFAVDTRQTWTAYRFLFEHFKSHPQVRQFRDRFSFIAALVPETERDAYLSSFREHAWNLFRETLYDEVAASAPVGDAFSFDLNDDVTAPHEPHPVFWNRGLQTFDPTAAVDVQAVESAYGMLLDRFDDQMLDPEPEQ